MFRYETHCIPKSATIGLRRASTYSVVQGWSGGAYGVTYAYVYVVSDADAYAVSGTDGAIIRNSC